MQYIRIWLNFLISYIFPPSCIICGTHVSEAKKLCFCCFNKLNFISKPYCKICGKVFEVQIFNDLACASCIANPPKFDIARYLLKFDEHSKHLIHSFKYFDQTAMAELFAKMIVERYGYEFENIDIIVPVPMNRFKRLFRMYNHAQVLGLAIAKILNKPLISDLLIKTKWTKSQTSLSKKAREKNLNASLKFNTKYNIQSKTILLVDDVKTTGETIKKCCRILKNRKITKIYVATIAAT